MTRVVFSALLGAILLSAVPAAADVLPPAPARPSWEDTPLPMPEDPDLAILVVALVTGFAVAGTLAAERERRERV